MFFLTIRRLRNPFPFVKQKLFQFQPYFIDNTVNMETNWQKLNYLSSLSLVLNSICVRNTNCGGQIPRVGHI